MIELKFSDFYKSNYEDIGYVLYLVKDAYGQAIYIGISTESDLVSMVWNSNKPSIRRC